MIINESTSETLTSQLLSTPVQEAIIDPPKVQETTNKEMLENKNFDTPLQSIANSDSN